MIPVNEPLISKNARKYIDDCIDTGWVSSAGSYITKFEEAFARFCGTRYATTVTNGTAALHLALASFGIGPGDEVILPDLTIISCALAIHYTGATPVVVDVEPDTGNIDTSKIEAAITPKTKAIMVVHLYGHPCDMDPILAIVSKHGLVLIEDAAEAHGSLYKGKPAGSFGHAAAFSFYGNKIITTGEGGMVVTNSDAIIEKARLLKNLAHLKNRRFFHEEIGFNYRMTNLQAALGLAELEEVEAYIAKKIRMAKIYTAGLSDIKTLELPVEKPYARSVYWMYAVKLKPSSSYPKLELMRKLKDEFGIDTREFFYPLSDQPAGRAMNLQCPYPTPQTHDLSHRGLYLPSGLAMTEKQIHTVINALHSVLG